LLNGESLAAGSFRHKFGDERVDGDKLHANADPGDHAPQVDAAGGVLERHHQSGDTVPDKRIGKDGAAPEPVRGLSEEHRADEQPSEQGGNERREAGEPEQGNRRRREDLVREHARRD
jgi:hypothetical protein